jgi:Flp pilus assembly CpaF family ATPase
MTAASARMTDTNHRRGERSRRIAEKLERELGPLVFACLRDPHVVDIILNPDGGIWVERLGGAPERLGEMPSHQAEALIATVAAELQTVVTAERPILECELPIDGSRFTAVIPPVVTAPAFAIRRRASQIINPRRLCLRWGALPIQGGPSRQRHRTAPKHRHCRRYRLRQDHARQCADRAYGGGLAR